MQYRILRRERFNNESHALTTISANSILYPNWEVIPIPEEGFEIDVWADIIATDDDDCALKVKQHSFSRGFPYHEVLEIDSLGNETAKFCLSDSKKQIKEGIFSKARKERKLKL